MKSYWIAATVLLTAWPLSTKANASLNQTKAEEAVQAVQPSNTSQTVQSPVSGQKQVSGTEAGVAASSTASPAAAAAKPANSYLLVELSNGLKAKKLKPGDKVKAEVSQDVISHGKIIIPVETKLIGHVTEVQVRDAENHESRLGIVFDRILLKHHDINFQGVVQAVSAPVIRRSRVDEPSQMLPPSIGMAPRTSNSIGGGTKGSGTIQTTGGSSAAATQSADITPYTTQVEVRQSPMTNAAGGASAAQLKVGAGSAKPLSVGTPEGVIGIKGLGLSKSSGKETPGPVIVSTSNDVKLESGTQILVHVLSVEAATK